MAGLLRSHIGFRRLWIGDGLSKLGSRVDAPGRTRPRRHRARRQHLAGRPARHVRLRAAGAVRAARRRVGRPAAAPTGAGRGGSVSGQPRCCPVPVAALLDQLSMTQLYVVEFRRRRWHGGVRRVPARLSCPGWSAETPLVEADGRLEVEPHPGLPRPARPSGGLSVGWFGEPPAQRSPVRSGSSGRRCGSAPSALRRRPRRGGSSRPSVAWLAESARACGSYLTEPFIRATTLYGCAAVACLATRYAVETLFLLRDVGLEPAGSASSVPPRDSAASPARSRRRHWRDARRGAGWPARRWPWVQPAHPADPPGWGLVPYTSAPAWSESGSWSTAWSALAVANACALAPARSMNATSRFLSWATLPLGGVLGGRSAPCSRCAASCGSPRSVSGELAGIGRALTRRPTLVAA